LLWAGAHQENIPLFWDGEVLAGPLTGVASGLAWTTFRDASAVWTIEYATCSPAIFFSRKHTSATGAVSTVIPAGLIAALSAALSELNNSPKKLRSVVTFVPREVTAPVNFVPCLQHREMIEKWIKKMGRRKRKRYLRYRVTVENPGKVKPSLFVLGKNGVGATDQV